MATIQIRRAAPEEQAVIANLSQFYIYEFGPIMAGITLQDDGTYTPLPDLDAYWTDPNRHPLLVSVDGELAGFVLVEAGHATEPNSINEFFIARKFMGKGVGRQVARQVFDLFRGRWQVTQIRKNYGAQAFWRSVIAEYTGDTFMEYYDAKRRSVQEFDNSATEGAR
jgi:predicted acetyltransferase